MHELTNSFLTIHAREQGAELTSVYDKRNNIEHLWQANPAVWGWHAPVLFPIVGRCLNDEIWIDGTAYKMEKHGFARNSAFKLLDLNDTQMIFSLQASAATLKNYPYRFELLIGYRLEAHRLHVTYEVVNRDNKPVYFSIGGHPAFAAPFLPAEKYGDYYLEFEQTENSLRHLINFDGFFDGRTEPSLTNTNTLPLQSEMFIADALIYKDLKSRQVTLKSQNNPHYLSVNFAGFSQLGLWAKTNAPYVCIEPWLGCADTAGKQVEFKNKEGIIALAEKEKFMVGFVVEVG